MAVRDAATWPFLCNGIVNSNPADTSLTIFNCSSGILLSMLVIELNSQNKLFPTKFSPLTVNVIGDPYN